MKWWQYKPIISAHDALASGACYAGVMEAVSCLGLAMITEAVPAKYAKQALIASSGDGYGYGSGDGGYGSGDGYGDGSGSGDGYGDGYGYGGDGGDGYGDSYSSG